MRFHSRVHGFLQWKTSETSKPRHEAAVSIFLPVFQRLMSEHSVSDSGTLLVAARLMVEGWHPAASAVIPYLVNYNNHSASTTSRGDNINIPQKQLSLQPYKSGSHYHPSQSLSRRSSSAIHQGTCTVPTHPFDLWYESLHGRT